MEPRLIGTETDYVAALKRIAELMSAEPGTPQGDELRHLSILVEAYENERYPIDAPDPVSAIRFRMEQMGLRNADLIPYMGSKSKVSEVLSGRRCLSLRMIRRLHSGLGIPADVLLTDTVQEADLVERYQGIHWSRFPLTEMLKRGWFPAVQGGRRDLLENAEEILGPLLFRDGLQQPVDAWLRRRTARAGPTHDAALWAWLARVLQVASQQEIDPYEPGIVTEDFIRGIAQLSCLNEGPRLAEESLLKSGIHFVIERQFPSTRLDGAAACCPDGSPVVALTLRYDRLDHFWFTLCHELAHVAVHFDTESPRAFADCDLQSKSTDGNENEADLIAAQALIPQQEWEQIKGGAPSIEEVSRIARRLRVHPAVVAGRFRHQKQDYRIYSKVVGQGEVRRLFGL